MFLVELKLRNGHISKIFIFGGKFCDTSQNHALGLARHIIKMFHNSLIDLKGLFALLNQVLGIFRHNETADFGQRLMNVGQDEVAKLIYYLYNFREAYFWSWGSGYFPKPVRIWIILNQISSVTNSPDVWISWMMTSTYQTRSSANFSVSIAIFRINSSLKTTSASSV